MGAFLVWDEFSIFFSLFFQGHINRDDVEGGLVFHILLCLRMLFRKVCILQKPPTPALHLQIISYF